MAQFQNNLPLYISDNSFVYIGSGAFNFGTGGQTKTTRTDNTYGKLIFGPGVSTTGASDTYFLDGYASRSAIGQFLFPVGQTLYAPVQLSTSTTDEVDVAYYRASAAGLGATLDSSLESISTTEYWNINGTNLATITLTWRDSSDLTAIGVASSTSNLTIVGFDGSKWVKITSTVDDKSIVGDSSSTIQAGSITSSEAVDLSIYSYFSLGTENISCSPIVAAGITKIWDGTSWSPSGTPTLENPVIINGNFAGSLVCNSLVLNADITLTGSQNVEIVNGASGTGSIFMSSESSVVQRATGVDGPNIVLTKTTRAMRQYDYIYWGTPIAGNFFAQLDGAKASTNAAGLNNAFDTKLKYVSGTGGGWQIATAIETGKGFATRVRNQAPFNNTATTDVINLTFTGKANNGDLSVAITNDLAFPNGGRSHVFVANPYPSAIDADKFLTENTNIDGVVYVWQAATQNDGLTSYSQADYIAYTLAGSVVPSAITQTFNGKIASGQGFHVKSLVNSGSVVFNNCMRLTTDNDQFKKVAAPKQELVNRFKLNLTNNDGVFSQILVAYMPEATLGYDRMYDAGRNSVSTAQLYSIFEIDGRKLAINARPEFDVTDVVTLGISNTATTEKIYTISITGKEGIFASNVVNVLLHDKTMNTFTDLALGDYTFSSSSTSMNDRFKIVYTYKTLNTPEYDSKKVIATIYKQMLQITASLPLTEVSIYDLSGRLVTKIKGNNQLAITNSFCFADGIYIAKIKTNNGAVATHKLINKK